MSLTMYNCGTCGASFGITGPGSGTDDDYAAEDHFSSEVEYHESGQCSPAPADPQRAEYVAGLHALAEFLAEHPEVQLPYNSGADGEFASTKVTFYLGSKDKLAAFARAFPGKLEKRVNDESLSYGFELHGNLHGLYLYAAAHRDEVCERVVVGTREVTKTVPAPDAPMVEITETVEDVEWRCQPLLAEVVEPEAVSA